jgi:hypothetical protein
VSTADHVAWTAPVSPTHQVEVDDEGQVQVAVKSGSTRLDSRVSPDGYARSDVSNIAALVGALHQAQFFARVVFPPDQSAGTWQDSPTWQERRDAFNALKTAGKLTSDGGSATRCVRDFLTDWRGLQKLVREGHRLEQFKTMEEYAEKEWERWW